MPTTRIRLFHTPLLLMWFFRTVVLKFVDIIGRRRGYHQCHYDQMPTRRFPCKMNVTNPRRSGEQGATDCQPSVPQNKRLIIILNQNRHQVKRDFKITVGSACGNFEERYLNVTLSR
ncbi:Uncharacterized protein APZ42_023557 [Daphnia magna]|uniref:Uncharacterized protein n=1 Tax=Daphnia magna TaxID=35525 RepID=A0A0P5YL78_9CRUS|nr:Uncharacterized protein APZ42_023557 [Daphnia magna]